MLRVTQGNYEQSFNGGEAIVLRPNAAGNLRMYFRTNNPTPATLAADFGHPSKFGYRGMDPMQVRRVFRMDPQGDGARQRANVRFTTASPGNATIGYRITGANNPSIYRQIPKNCLSGVLTIRVQGGGGGGGASQINTSPGQAPGARQVWVAGRYNTDFGEMVLEQNGTSVNGSYALNGGRIIGTLQGNILYGTWSQQPSYRPPNDSGEIKFTFGDAGNFAGAWRYGNRGQWEQWNGRSMR